VLFVDVVAVVAVEEVAVGNSAAVISYATVPTLIDPQDTVLH